MITYTIVTDHGGEILYKAISDFQFKEDIIVQKSIDLYAEPCPCIIYRSCIINKLVLEFNERCKAFFSQKEKKQIRIYQDEIFDYLDIKDTIHYIDIAK